MCDRGSIEVRQAFDMFDSGSTGSSEDRYVFDRCSIDVRPMYD